MAKNAKIASAPVAGEMLVSKELSFGKHGSFTIGSLPEAALTYLVTYGYNKSRQDAVAGMRKELTEAKDAEGNLMYPGADQVQAELDVAMTERLEAIFEGKVGTRNGGPRLRGLDWWINQVAEEWLKAAAAKAGKKLPVKDAWREAVAKFATIQAGRIRPEAERRMADASEGGDSLGDILG